MYKLITDHLSGAVRTPSPFSYTWFSLIDLVVLAAGDVGPTFHQGADARTNVSPDID